MKTSFFYSGGAIGSDCLWAAGLRACGHIVTEYIPKDYDMLPLEWQDIIDRQYKEVVNLIGRRVLNKNTYSGKLVRRDMMQADKATALFAICRLGTHHEILGGSAYAITRAMIRRIPVYVFNQDEDQWYLYYLSNNIIYYKPINKDQVKLQDESAVIGTREINETGKNAINELIYKFNQN